MRKKSAFILVFVLVMMVLIILSLTALFYIAYNDLALAKRTSISMRAYYLAEAGIAKRFMDLRTEDPPNTGTTTGTFTFTNNGADSGTFSVNTTLVSTGVYTLVSTGTYKNVSRVVSFTIRQVSFSRYSYLSNSESQLFWFWKNPIWFTTGDLLTGPLFTNDQLNIYGNPIFEGPVSSVNSAINYYNGGPPEDNPEFRDSLTLGATALKMPSTLGVLSSIQTAAAQSTGLTLTPAASPAATPSITFLSNGTLNFYNGKITTNYSLPSNGAIYVSSGNVSVSGIVNGNVTLGAPNNIFITNNVLYNNDPRTNPSSTDMLGLVAQNYVYVASSAPDNLEVDAYIVALNNSFEVYDYDSTLKGTLSLYGGVTQTVRGAVGTFNATTGDRVSGYVKNYQYDPRLELVAPVCFPPARDANNRIVYLKVLWAEQ
ncbi:MAG: hypothetical protein PHI58_05550 [Candidatus Omnitrophica bacterium]|nr:hypothetical protein [Candidatus Omnitrophota bacterium]